MKINTQYIKSYLSTFDVFKSKSGVLAKNITQNIYKDIARNMKQLADQNLQTSKAEYKRGIKITPDGIMLVGSLPNMIENGVSAFDMRSVFALSAKKKYAKDGSWYVIIPFKIGTPNSNAKVKFTKEQYAYAKAGKPLPQRLLGKKGKRAAFTDLETGTTYKAYKHKNNLLDGLKKTVVKKGGTSFKLVAETANTMEWHKVKTQAKSTYNTFRVISSKGAGVSWIHPGIFAHNFADKAVNMVNIDDIINDVIDKYI
jgi:hypothetical protein